MNSGLSRDGLAAEHRQPVAGGDLQQLLLELRADRLRGRLADLLAPGPGVRPAPARLPPACAPACWACVLRVLRSARLELRRRSR